MSSRQKESQPMKSSVLLHRNFVWKSRTDHPVTARFEETDQIGHSTEICWFRECSKLICCYKYAWDIATKKIRWLILGKITVHDKLTQSPRPPSWKYPLTGKDTHLKPPLVENKLGTSMDHQRHKWCFATSTDWAWICGLIHGEVRWFFTRHSLQFPVNSWLGRFTGNK